MAEGSGTTLTYDPNARRHDLPLDRKYADWEAETRWQITLDDAQINQAAEAGPVPTPEAVAAAPKGAEPTPAPPAPGRGGAAVETPPPGAPPTAPPAGQPAPGAAPLPLNVAETLSRLAGQPLPLTTAAQAAFNAAAETAKHLVFGAKQTVFPEETPAGKQARAAGAAEGHPILGAVTGRMADHARGVYEFIVEGLMGAIGIPFTAIEAGLEQQIENQNPAALDTVVLDSGPAAVVRNFTGQGNPLEPLGENPTEEARARQAWLNSPMTLREALHIGVQTAPFWMPGVAGGARKGAQQLYQGAARIPAHARSLLAEGLPAPAEGTVRLYRGEAIATGRPLPTWLQAASEESGHAMATGRWYTPSKEIAEWYVRDASAPLPAAQRPGHRGGRLVYVDVPTAVYEQSRLANQPPGVQRFSRDLEQEHFLPPEYRGQGKPVPGALLDQIKSERGAMGFPPEPGTPTTPVEGPRPLNLERIDAPDAVKGIMQRLDELVNAGEPLKGHRARQTHAETIAMAKERGLNLERMMKQDPTTFLPDEATQTALRDAHNATAQVLDDLEQRMAAGDPVARAEYPGAFSVAMKLGELDVAGGTNLARGLESRTIPSKAERAQMKGLADLAAKIKNISGVAPEELAAMRAHLTAAQQMTWMQALGASANLTRDVLHTLWIQSLLTNPVTHTVNPFGSFAALAWDAVAERPMAELVNRWLTRDPEGIAAGEALAAVSHPIEAMKDAVRLFGETWKTNTSPFEKDTNVGGLFEGLGGRFGQVGEQLGGVGEATTAGKAGAPRINAQKYGWNPETLPGAFIDALGAGLDNPLLPTGWLRLEDAIPKGVAYRMEIRALAVWEAQAEMRAAEAAGTPWTPEQYVARLKDLGLNPTESMKARAGDHAVQITMNADLGPIGTLVTKLANTVPFGRWLVPFIRFGGNAFSWTAQRLPVTGEISALMGKNRADFEAGGRLRDQAIARMIVGHSVALIIHQEVFSGNITGSGALTQKMAGDRPFRECPSYSMKIGGDCMPANYLRTFGQAGLLVAAVADFAELSREIPDQRWYDEWAAQANAVATALGYTFVNQTSMQGLAHILESIKDPLKKGNAVAIGFARSAIPAGVRQYTRVQDDNIIRDVHTITDAIRSGLPWTVEGVAPKRHPITGAVRHMPAGWGWELVSPIFWQQANTDPVDKAIIDNEVSAPELPKSIGGSNNPGDVPRMTEPLPGEGVKLSDLERHHWIDHMTQDTLKGLTLHETLLEVIQSQRYKDGLAGKGDIREHLMTVEIQAFRKMGLAALLKDPRHADLEAKYEAALRTKANALRPAADPRNPRNPANPARLLESLGR